MDFQAGGVYGAQRGIEAVRQLLFKPSDWQAQTVDLQAEHQTGQHKMLGQLAGDSSQDQV
jgi:hypothetical protein